MGTTKRYAVIGAVAALISTLVVAGYLQQGARPASAAGGGCTASTLVPTFHVDSTAPANSQFMLSQGLPTYSGSTSDPTTNLVRGKDTLARLFLSLPSCARSQSISVTGGSISVANGATALGTGTMFTAAPLNLPAFYTGNPPANTATDPVFVVPGKDLTPCGASASCPTNTAGFTATFTISLSYTATGVTGTQTATFTQSAPVAQKSNALRILVVPMGNATAPNTRSSQYSTNADSAVQQAMNTLSRIYPVPCDANPADPTGACFSSSLTSTFGGVRYSVDPGMLDLSTITGAFDSNGKFCGGQSNWDALKASLGQFLQSYNTANPSAPADRAVGVVDEAISDGVFNSPSGFSCAEGMASSGAVGAWTRATYSSPPSLSGGVLGMEIEHTFGGVPTSRSLTMHSPNSPADGTAPGRAYNLSQRAQVGSSRSDMKLDPSLPWNNDTTVAEQLDQQFMLCNLGGPIDSECTTSGTTGTTTGVGAGATFIMSGITQVTDQTVNGATNVVESYYSTDVAQPSFPDPAAPNAASFYRLVQCSASPCTTANTVNNAGVTVSFQNSTHAPGTNNVVPATPNGVFSIAFQGFTGISQIALYFCPSTASGCQSDPVGHGGIALYQRIKAANPPAVTSITTTGTTNVTDYSQNHAVDDVNPALNDHAVAWVAPCTQVSNLCKSGVTAIHLAPTSAANPFVEVPLSSDGAQSDPAWRPDHTALVFAAGGSLWTVSVNTTTTPFTVGTPVRIYSKSGPTPAADSPTWSFDGSTIFFHASNAGLRMIPAGGGATNPVPSNSPADFSPSASPTANQVAFMLQGNDKQNPSMDIWLDDISAGTARLVVTNGSQPWFGDDGQIYFVRSGQGIFRVKTDGTGLTQLTSGTTDANPAEWGGTLGFDRPLPTDREIMLASLSGSTTTVTATGSNLVGELDLTCPNGVTYPINVGIPASSVSQAATNFTLTYDGSGSCGGTGTLTFVVMDGFARSSPTTISQVQVVNTNKPPTAAITAPASENFITSNANLPLNGSGTSLQDGTLTGSSLVWFASGTGLPRTQIATGNVIDVTAPAGGWPCGTLTIELDVTDSGGRTAVATTLIPVDCTAPTTPIITPGAGASNPTNSTSATFTFSSSDPDPGDSVSFQCQLDNGTRTPCTSPQTFTGLADGSHTFIVYATDRANNTSSSSYTWLVDTTPPTTTASQSPLPSSNGWNNTSPVTVTLTATDVGSGVKQISYALTGAQTGGTTVQAATTSFPISAEGITTVTYHATDNAGNTEAAKQLVVKIDTIAPTTAASVSPTPNGAGWNNGSSNPPATVTLTATDATSGVQQITYTLTGAQTGGATVQSATTSFPITTQGVTTVTFQATDVAGNTETAKQLVVKVDTTGPTTSISTFLVAIRQLQGSASDNMSGVASVSVHLSGSGGTFDIAASCPGCGAANPPGPTFTSWTADLSGVPIGVYNATASAVDVAGNQGPPSSAFTVAIS